MIMHAKNSVVYYSFVMLCTEPCSSMKVIVAPDNHKKYLGIKLISLSYCKTDYCCEDHLGVAVGSPIAAPALKYN